MDLNAVHVSFAIAAYAVSAFAIILLCGIIFWRDSQLTKQLKKLEDQKKN